MNVAPGSPPLRERAAGRGGPRLRQRQVRRGSRTAEGPAARENRHRHGRRAAAAGASTRRSSRLGHDAEAAEAMTRRLWTKELTSRKNRMLAPLRVPPAPLRLQRELRHGQRRADPAAAQDGVRRSDLRAGADSALPDGDGLSHRRSGRLRKGVRRGRDPGLHRHPLRLPTVVRQRPPAGGRIHVGPDAGRSRDQAGRRHHRHDGVREPLAAPGRLSDQTRLPALLDHVEQSLEIQLRVPQPRPPRRDPRRSFRSSRNASTSSTPRRSLTSSKKASGPPSDRSRTCAGCWRACRREDDTGRPAPRRGRRRDEPRPALAAPEAAGAPVALAENGGRRWRRSAPRSSTWCSWTS